MSLIWDFFFPFQRWPTLAEKKKKKKIVEDNFHEILSITPDKMGFFFFSAKSAKHAMPRHFLQAPTTYFFMGKYEKCYVDNPTYLELCLSLIFSEK